MKKFWILIADQSKARFFILSDTHSGLQEIHKIEHPQGRELEQALSSDRPGRNFDSKGQGRHTMGSEIEPGKHETIQFAKQVVDHVRSAHNDRHCDRLLLVAGSPMLGLLREDLKTIPGMTITEFDKNLGQFDATEIRAHLPERL
jgi:protein required for attachment to host cells